MNSVSNYVSNDQARAVALDAQGFTSSQVGGLVTLRHFRAAIKRLHVLQLDAVPVVARTQYLPAFSRLGPYRADMLDQVAYRRDEWFETWAHEASLMPVAYQPLMRWSYQRASAGQIWRSLAGVANENAGFVKQVLHQVRRDGPLRASQLENPGPRSAVGGWSNRTTGALALSYLFRCGELGIRRVGNFEKEFDLIERIVPAEVLAKPTPNEPDALRELLILSAQAHGLGTADDLIDYFRLPIRAARPLFDSLVEDGRLIVCQVEGWKAPAYAPTGQMLRSIRRQASGTDQRRALLSPFDPVVWYRKRALRLFNFDYRLEIYTPEKKRRWGYYVFPFLLGDALVGRCDLKFDRNTGVLRVPAAHIEAGSSPDRVAPAMAAELMLMAQWLGAKRVVAGRRGGLISALRAALKAFE